MLELFLDSAANGYYDILMEDADMCNCNTVWQNYSHEIIGCSTSLWFIIAILEVASWKSQETVQRKGVVIPPCSSSRPHWLES
jgi:hypothetical protein